MKRTTLVLTIAVLCATAAVSEAQPIEAGVSIATGAVSSLGSDFGSDGVFGGRGPGLAGHVSLPVNERFAVQPFVSYSRWTDTPHEISGFSGGTTDGRNALFGVVVEQRFSTSRASLRPFMTYGLAAAYQRKTVAPAVYSDGGRPQTIPGYTSSYVEEVPVSLFGGGIQQRLGRHLSIRAEGQVLGVFIVPLGVRASIGLAVAFGQ